MDHAALVPGRLSTVFALLAKAVLQALLNGVQLERILADDDFACSLQRRPRCFAAGHLAQAIDAVVCDQLDDDTQRVGRMQARCIEQRRIGDGDGGDVHFGDLHFDSSSLDLQE